METTCLLMDKQSTVCTHNHLVFNQKGMKAEHDAAHWMATGNTAETSH